jgi:hypothetical protein
VTVTVIVAAPPTVNDMLEVELEMTME